MSGSAISLELLSIRPTPERDKYLDAANFDGRITYRVYTTRPYRVLREWNL